MRIVFLGTGGYFATERRQTACVLLPESGIVFDAGSGMYRLPEYLQSSQLDIFLSHGHLDHICGLTTLLVPQQANDLQQINVHATQPVLDAIQTHLFNETIFPVLPKCNWQSVQQQLTFANQLQVESMPLKSHPGGSTGYKCTQGEISLAYMTDTTVDGTYDDFIKGVDLLVHECYFPNEKANWAEKTGHSHTTAVAELAARTNVKRLVLVHVDPTQASDDPIDLEQARTRFPQTELATDLYELQL